MAIQSFADKDTAEFFTSGKIGKRCGWRSLALVARRKLDMVHYASILDDLKSPPGNRLEALSGDMRGLHSVRNNDQWRVVFRWTSAGPVEVAIRDYH
jgi:toxin HigB-1